MKQKRCCYSLLSKILFVSNPSQYANHKNQTLYNKVQYKCHFNRVLFGTCMVSVVTKLVKNGLILSNFGVREEPANSECSIVLFNIRDFFMYISKRLLNSGRMHLFITVKCLIFQI